MLKIDNSPVRFLEHKYNYFAPPSQTTRTDPVHKLDINGVTIFDDTCSILQRLLYTANLISASPVTWQYDAYVTLKSPVRADGYPLNKIAKILITITDVNGAIAHIEQVTPFINQHVARGIQTFNDLTGQFEYEGDVQIKTFVSIKQDEYAQDIWVQVDDFTFTSRIPPYTVDNNGSTDYIDF